MISLADRDAASGVKETYQYIVDDSAFHFVVDDGSIEVHDGHAPDAAVVLTTDEQTWTDIAFGKITPSEAAAKGRLATTGDRDAAKRLAKIFSRHHMLTQSALAGRPN
ncbi:MAG: SCP2 sterol-binding domain-containing protein [Actinomycetota bacterium]|nr:SCP2 sterol-binding domain-containing protein [Actinomycetota bacterium]